jgi:hypothetical protein
LEYKYETRSQKFTSTYGLKTFFKDDVNPGATKKSCQNFIGEKHISFAKNKDLD